MGSRGRASVSGGGWMPGRGGGTETRPPSAGASLRLTVRVAGEDAVRKEGRGGAQTDHHMLSGHLRLSAAKTHSHLNAET